MLVLLIRREYITYVKYAVEIGSGTIIYIPSFTKTSSGIQKLLDIQTDRQTAR
jgi:hypothetical protein